MGEDPDHDTDIDRLGRALGHQCPECDAYAMTGTTRGAPDGADELLTCPHGHEWGYTYDDTGRP